MSSAGNNSAKLAVRTKNCTRKSFWARVERLGGTHDRLSQERVAARRHIYFSARACCILHKQLHAHSRSKRTNAGRQARQLSLFICLPFDLCRGSRGRSAREKGTGPRPARRRRVAHKEQRRRPQAPRRPPGRGGGGGWWRRRSPGVECARRLSQPLCVAGPRAGQGHPRCVALTFGVNLVFYYTLCGSRLGTEVALWFRSGKWALAHQIYVCLLHYLSFARILCEFILYGSFLAMGRRRERVLAFIFYYTALWVCLRFYNRALDHNTARIYHMGLCE